MRKVGFMEHIPHVLAFILCRPDRIRRDPVVWFVLTLGKMGQWVLSAELALAKNSQFKAETGLY